jgi:hypothetical protein
MFVSSGSERYERRRNRDRKTWSHGADSASGQSSAIGTAEMEGEFGSPSFAEALSTFEKPIEIDGFCSSPSFRSSFIGSAFALARGLRSADPTKHS